MTNPIEAPKQKPADDARAAVVDLDDVAGIVKAFLNGGVAIVTKTSSTTNA